MPPSAALRPRERTHERCGADRDRATRRAVDCSEVLHRVYEYLDGEMTAGRHRQDQAPPRRVRPVPAGVRPRPGAQGAGQAVLRLRGGSGGAADPDHGPDHHHPLHDLGVAAPPHATQANARRGGRTSGSAAPSMRRGAGSGVGLAAVVGRVALARAALAGALAHGCHSVGGGVARCAPGASPLSHSREGRSCRRRRRRILLTNPTKRANQDRKGARRPSRFGKEQARRAPSAHSDGHHSPVHDTAPLAARDK